MFVDVLEHQKANGAVQRGNEKNRIDHGNMVRRKQRAAPGRNLFAPGDIEAVESVRCEPQQKPKQ